MGEGGDVRERRQKEGGGEETDQCSAAWEASHPLFLTRPKHFEACFHREQLVCETTGVKLTLVAPPTPRTHLPFLRERAVDGSFSG